MRNALHSGVSRYRESPVGRLHVHLGRLLLVYVLLVSGIAVTWLTLEVLPVGSSAYVAGEGLKTVLIDGLALGVVFSPLQALVVTALWGGWESREEGY